MYTVKTYYVSFLGQKLPFDMSGTLFAGQYRVANGKPLFYFIFIFFSIQPRGKYNNEILDRLEGWDIRAQCPLLTTKGGNLLITALLEALPDVAPRFHRLLTS